MSSNLNNLNGTLINNDASHWAGNAFTNRVIPSSINPNVFKEPQSNIQAAASDIPCFKGGKRINRKKINKISRQYKMKGSKKTVRRNIRRIKSHVRSKYASKKHLSKKNKSRKNKSRKNRKTRSYKKRRSMKGGVSMPNYPLGYSQYNNNEPISSTYSTGGPLSPSLSALANPVPHTRLANTAIDNLDHNAKNTYGNNVGAGFASRGWW
jgi:hypothetical protein